MENMSTAVSVLLGNLVGPILVSIVIFFLGLIFQAGFKRSLRGGLYTGIGLAGLFVIVNNAIAVITPALQIFSQNFNKSMAVTDVGWGSAVLAFAWPGLAFTFFSVFAVNIILVMLKIVKTMWTDVWSIWHGQVVGAFCMGFNRW